MGELEIKVETIRYVVCAGSDLLQDASFNVESLIFRKAATGFRNTINNAIIAGDGLGKPLGILNPQSGIPICETADTTPLGQFTWQDLVALKMEVPMKYHAGGSFLMNEKNVRLADDHVGREQSSLVGAIAGRQPGFLFPGSPIVIASHPRARSRG